MQSINTPRAPQPSRLSSSMRVSRFLSHLKHLKRRGDTLIEVAISIATFSLVTIITITSMNRSLELMEGSIELTMTRNEIDAQAEALRFIQNSYLSERELAGDSSNVPSEYRQYEGLWDRLTSLGGLSNNPTKISAFTANSCSVYYNTGIGRNNSENGNHNIFDDPAFPGDKAFILNTRHLDPQSILSDLTDTNQTIVEASENKFKATTLYPRVVFTSRSSGTEGNSESALDESGGLYDKISTVEGLWIIGARDVTGVSSPSTATDASLANSTPQFYDFYIRACWYAPADVHPSMISTIVRLYNPEYVE